MNLNMERLELLRALSHDRETLAVCDAPLRSAVSKEIAKIGKTKDRTLIFENLKKLYRDFDLAVIRAIFENAHLLKQIDVENVIEPFFSEVVKELSSDTAEVRRIEVLVHEIEKFIQSPHVATQFVVEKLFKELLENDQAVVLLLKSNRLIYPFRKDAAMVCVTRQLVVGYDAVINLVKHVSHNDEKSADYDNLVIPLLPVLNKMGSNGLFRLVELFNNGELGRHGAKLLVELGDSFVNWFLDSDLKPESKWVNPLLQAVFKVDNHTLRNRMTRKIIDTFDKNENAKDIMIRKLRARRAHVTNFTNAFDADVKSKIFNLIGPVPKPIDTSQVMMLANGEVKSWDKFVKSVDIVELDARAFANLFTKVKDKGRYRILNWINSINPCHFIGEFYEHLLEPTIFSVIKSSFQSIIVKNSNFVSNVRADDIEALLEADIPLVSAVVDQLNAIAKDLRATNV